MIGKGFWQGWRGRRYGAALRRKRRLAARVYQYGLAPEVHELIHVSGFGSEIRLDELQAALHARQSLNA